MPRDPMKRDSGFNFEGWLRIGVAAALAIVFLVLGQPAIAVVFAAAAGFLYWLVTRTDL